jgi:hypothetical protein
MSESPLEQQERDEGAVLEGAEMPEASDEEEGEPTGAESDSSARKELSFGTMAGRNVARARKLFGSERDPEEMAQFMVQSATVYAILELADAVRGQQTETE